MRARSIVVMALMGLPTVSLAQDRPAPNYTQMLLGFGPTPSGTAAMAGFEHRLSDGRVSFRVMADYLVNSTSGTYSAGDPWSDWSRLGVSVLGFRHFRSDRRVQPYLLAGLGVHRDWGYSTPPDQGPWGTGTGPLALTYGPPRAFTSTAFGAVWGMGTSMRVGRVDLFGELKLQMTTRPSRLTTGHHVPLTFGIRF